MKSKPCSHYLVNEKYFFSYFLDELRQDAADLVKRMHEMNFEVVMLTGDHREVAEQVIF
jgi:P-type E1-E2 ATPase